MPEYIEREAFLDYMKGTSRYFNVKFDIENFPTADVVKVTRCKDCRHHSAAAGVCNLYLHFSVGVTANDYCSYGERRTV